MAVWVHQEGQSQRRLSNLHWNHQSHCQRDPKTVTYLNIEDFPLFLFCYRPMPGICCKKKNKIKTKAKNKKKDKGKAFSVSLFTSWINQARNKIFLEWWFVLSTQKKFRMVWWEFFKTITYLRLGRTLRFSILLISFC